jgi:hypothetical protein
MRYYTTSRCEAAANGVASNMVCQLANVLKGCCSYRIHFYAYTRNSSNLNVDDDNNNIDTMLMSMYFGEEKEIGKRSAIVQTRLE